MDQFPIQDDCLVVGGRPLPQLVQCVGSTPFYVYDRRLVTQRVEEVRRALPAPVKLHYAVKANPMPALLCHMASLVDGLDVASGKELLNALPSGVNARDISFAGPGKSVTELEQAVASGILINVESLRELHCLANLSARVGLAARVAIRVNPEFELKTSGMRMGGGAKQFGMDADAVPAALREAGSLGLAFEGFHIYSGSQNLRASAICEAQALAAQLAVQLAAHAPSETQVVNIGGGFGVP
jgi:diaminopimelate decarboxylase